MVAAVALVIGAVVAWVLADRWFGWMKARKHPESAAAWHGHGPGTTFHSTGFEDTLPPHEAADRRGRRPSSAVSASATGPQR